jgi:tetratricopeptide (TPR) repeat protein
MAEIPSNKRVLRQNKNIRAAMNKFNSEGPKREKVFKQVKSQEFSGDKINALESQLIEITQGLKSTLPEQKKSLTLSKRRNNLSKQKKQKKAKKQALKGMSPPEAVIESLLEHYQNGRHGDAEKLAVSITERFPEYQFGWKALGLVLEKTGRTNESLVPSQKSVQLAPWDAEAHNNLGITLKKLGRLEESRAIYAQAISLKPDFAGAHYNLGNTLKELGRLDEAVAGYTRAIALNPDYTAAHNNLGNTLIELGRLEKAEASLRQAIALKPDYAEAHSNLGATLQELGRLDEAEASLRQAIALNPDYAEAHYNLGNTLKELGRLDEAEASLRQAIALNPDYAEAHNNLGNTLKELGRLDEAEASYTQAIALKPEYPEAHHNLGNTLKGLGRLDEAEASYTQAIVLKPDYAEAHRHLTSMKKLNLQDEQYLKMQELYFDENISEEQRCHINFGLAKVCEDIGNFEQAYKHYREGNALRKEFLHYDISQDVEIFKKIKSNHSQIAKNSLEPDKSAKAPMPIFIVGMPRSGSTLVEQIISSHSQVTGAGELSFAAQFGGSIAMGFSEANREALLNFKDKYLEKIQNIASGDLFVTDKMPQNFRFIGLLASAFPEAKIVHVKRNPAAVCWGNYKQYFASEGLGYSFALDDVIKYYELYKNIMEFWAKQFPSRIHDVDYELLTVNQENETRKIINFIGLDWEEKCLSPQDNTRSVATASNMQVRQKVYLGSSQKWEKYKPFINGALDYLLEQ